MEVDTETTQFASKHRGATYYFSSQECKDKFENDPGKYAIE
jgi:YHS domain-containing protein